MNNAKSHKVTVEIKYNDDSDSDIGMVGTDNYSLTPRSKVFYNVFTVPENYDSNCNDPLTGRLIEDPAVDHWIPYSKPNGFNYQGEDDVNPEFQFSFKDGLYCSHIPNVQTLENYFFNKVLRLDPGEALDLITALSIRLTSGQKRRFFLRLLEELTVRRVLLQTSTPANERGHLLHYGLSKSMAITRILLMEQLVIQILPGKGSEISMSDTLQSKFDIAEFPVWNGSLTEFLEFISIALYLDKFSGAGKYKVVEILLKAFQVKGVSNKPITGQRLEKLLNRKSSAHPLIDSYVKLINDKLEDRKTKKKLSKR